MSLQIVSRAAWGAQDWETTPHAVQMSERQYFVIHYDGGNPITRTGTAIPQAIDAEHRAKGWSGIGYNFVASQAGEIYEGRGWGLVGAHCPGRNRNGLGVQIAIGGSQRPTPEALHAVRALYAEACARAGRALTITWHGANYATECPGSQLIPWARAGMPDPTPDRPGTVEDPMAAIDVPAYAKQTRDAILKASWGRKDDGSDYTLGDLLVEVRDGVRKLLTGLSAVQGQVAALDQRVASLEQRAPGANG